MGKFPCGGKWALLLPLSACQRSSAVEQGTHKPLVGGSIPLAGTNFP